MFGRRRPQRLVPDHREIFSPREFVKPVVHCPDNTADSKPLVAQELTDRFLLQRCIGAGITPCHLQIKGNETVARIPHQQDYLCSSKFSSRNEIFAAQAIPAIAFGSVLKTIVGEYHPGKIWMIVPPGLQSELQTVTLA